MGEEDALHQALSQNLKIHLVVPLIQAFIIKDFRVPEEDHGGY
jgi:hypothetical protein